MATSTNRAHLYKFLVACTCSSKNTDRTEHIVQNILKKCKNPVWQSLSSWGDCIDFERTVSERIVRWWSASSLCCIFKSYEGAVAKYPELMSYIQLLFKVFQFRKGLECFCVLCPLDIIIPPALLWYWIGRIQVAVKSTLELHSKMDHLTDSFTCCFAKWGFLDFPNISRDCTTTDFFNTHLCTSPCTKGRASNVWENKEQSLQSTTHIKTQYYHKVGSKIVTAKSRKVTQTSRVPYSNTFYNQEEAKWALRHHSHDFVSQIFEIEV